ncbi:hypothetical protein LPJ53_001771 [Coemansia erecta]|uniref:Uncharacterized protein n=1 Tax=Coemansia erecta TaxID=147472 RepID=A0A9W7Y475_9FUNG|nr:hypothetical protein LPJ53_001771 [Coemansia erecta]
MVQTLAIHARDYGADLAARLEVGRRAQEMVISIVENTVVWLFQIAFPAIGAFLTRCGEWIRQFITWWIDTGGPVARDIVEEVVLNRLVPTYHYLVEALGYGYQRAVWLGSRAIEAVYVLGMDLVHDINAVGGMMQTFVQWVSSNERWWFNPAIWQTLIEFGMPGYQWLLRVYSIAVDQFIPWCVATLFSSLDAVYTNALLPAACWCKSGADWLAQTAGRAVVASVDVLLGLYTTCVRVASSAAIFVGQLHAPLVRCFQAFLGLWTEMCDMLRRQSWIITVCLDAYSQARDAVFIPAISTLTGAIRFVWTKIIEPSASVVYIWLVDSLYPLARQWSELLLARIHVLFAWERISPFLALAWQRTQQLSVLLYHATSSSPAVAYLKTAMGDSVQVLQRWLGDILVYLWPLAQRGWSDAAQAMYDVYRQLVSLVDVAVAMVGDYIVEFARSNTVHSSVSEQSPALEKTKHAVGKDE